MIQLPDRLADLPTPSLVLDLDVLDDDAAGELSADVRVVSLSQEHGSAPIWRC